MAKSVTGIPIKDKRVQVYYDVVERDGLQEIRKRYWLHQRDKKMYAYVIDYKQDMSVGNNTVILDVDVIFVLNYNERVLENYNRPIVIVFRDKYYKAVAKPDEYEYYKSDIKVMAKRYTEFKEADEEYYTDTPTGTKQYIASIDGYVAIIDKNIGVIGG